jgi:hypothetical protein
MFLFGIPSNNLNMAKMNMKNEMLAKKQMVSKEAEPKAKGAKAIAT